MPELNDHKSRAHALLSASSAARWLACPPSAVIAEEYPSQETAFTREGTLAHEVAELVARARIEGRDISRFPWKDDITAEMVEHAQAYADYIMGLKQLDGDLVLLEQRVDFSPWVPQGFGTADCILVSDRKITVVDYKYGVGVPVSAVGNPQMKLYALGAYHLLRDLFVIDSIEMHIYQPRIDNVSVDRLSAAELLSWADDIVKPTAVLAAAGKGEFNAGGHCKFCPHAGKCRALTKTCWDFAEAHGFGDSDYTMDAGEVGDVLAVAPLIDIWLKRVQDQALKTLLEGGSIPGFKVVEGKLGNRKWSDELAVAAALDAAGVSREEYTETKLLSPAAMDKAIGKKKAAELLEGLIDRAPGKPTVVPASDKRPVYDRLAEARGDFA